MKYLSFLFLFFPFLSIAQQFDNIAGKVVEAKSEEVLIGASVYIPALKKGTSTNQYGFFSLRIPTGTYEIVVSYVGHTAQKIVIDTQKQYSLTVSLVGEKVLEEIIVKSGKDNFNEVGVTSISLAQLKEIPTILGESDILKALAFTPGVTNGAEGSAGLYVRGGTPDQNLVLLDEAPIYNTSHVFGFLSVFNTDAIKNIDLYKGGFPARFGGRLAAVMDISMKDGNKTESHRELSLGILSSRFLAEGPFSKGKSSYMFSGRTMNTGLVFLPSYIKRWTGQNLREFTSIWFYDINAKMNFNLNQNNQLYFSLYNNYDYWLNAEQATGRKEETTLNWGNTTSTLRYNHIFSNNLFAKVALIYSGFNYSFGNQAEVTANNKTTITGFRVRNNIRDWILKSGIEYTPSTTYTLRAGAEHIWHRFEPGSVEITSIGDEVNTIQISPNQPIFTQESSIYAENHFQTNNLRLNIGLRIANLSVEETSYLSFEPRLGLVYRIHNQHDIKIGYSRMSQFLHQLSSNGIGIPNDIWVTATPKVPPSQAQQIDLGWDFRLDEKKRWELSVDAYYKIMNNLIEYPQGADIVTNFKQNWQDLVVKKVEGQAYGVELMLRKNIGKINGWLSYTRSISERQASEINNGNWFPSRFQRENNLALVLNTHLNKKWSISANFVYQSGFPITLPEAVGLNLEGTPKLIYTDRNNARMPDYHRADIGFTKRYLTRRNREAQLSFGFYNVYNRSNPYYLVPSVNLKYTDLPNGQKSAVFDNVTIRLKNVIPILPYFSYQVKF
jgi:outer membrane receptor for ferrienterochelin and colicin